MMADEWASREYWIEVTNWGVHIVGGLLAKDASYISELKLSSLREVSIRSWSYVINL